MCRSDLIFNGIHFGGLTVAATAVFDCIRTWSVVVRRQQVGVFLSLAFIIRIPVSMPMCGIDPIHLEAFCSIAAVHFNPITSLAGHLRLSLAAKQAQLSVVINIKTAAFPDERNKYLLYMLAGRRR